ARALAFPEEAPVRELLRSGDGGAVRDLLVAAAEPHQRAHESAELRRLVLGQVARPDDLELAADRLADEEQVDEADDPRFLEALELGHDLAVELRPVELEDEHLHRPERGLRRAHRPRILRFCESNSSSVRMPWGFRSASCLSCSIASGEMPWLGAGGGGGGGAYAACCCCWYCCASRSCRRASVCASCSRPSCTFLPA